MLPCYFNLDITVFVSFSNIDKFSNNIATEASNSLYFGIRSMIRYCIPLGKKGLLVKEILQLSSPS